MDDRDQTREQLIEELQRLRTSCAELADSEKKFRALAESSAAQICIVQDDHYVYANQAFMDYHYLDDETLARLTPEELMMGSMTPEAIATATRAYEAAMERGDSRFGMEYQDADGAWLHNHVTMMELDGKPSVMLMSFDTTELKRAQSEMYRADKMAALGQIIAGVAHEINNPNNFIYFNLPILRRYIQAITPLLEQRLVEQPDLEILKMPYQTFIDDVFKLLQNMEHGSARITSIVSDLKNYVRCDVDDVRKVEPLEQVVDRVMTLVGKQVRKTVRRFDVDVADGLPAVEMNAGKIEQVLINLLINAGQAADKDESWVVLSVGLAEGAEGWVEIRVEDNGAGIRGDIREKIFEPFFTSKGRQQGTGLGLSISHRIIEEHGGTIDVRSVVGEGTCFTVRLPTRLDVPR